jgi:adenylate cyclase
LSWVAARFVGAAVTTNGSPETLRWMNYYGRPGSVLSVSYCDALKPGKVEDSFFRDKIVFVGSRIITKFAGERKDEYRTPFGFFVTKGAMFVPGVEIQATACMNLLREDWLRRLPLGAELAILILAGLVIGFGLMRLPPLTATGVSAVLLFLLFGVCYVAMLKLSWFVFFIVVVQVGFALVISVAYNSLQAYVQKRLAEQSLAFYLSPKLVKKFASNPSLLKPGAEKQTVTLLFTDIADFTKMSDGLDPDELAAVMNEYFERAVGQCIHKTDGTVVKFIGDAIFAFWNAPDPQPDHAVRACEATLYFLEFAFKPVRGRLLHTRIGLHSGVANVGNFGSVERSDYTAFGENVNLASRLEGLNKYLGTTCVMSGDTFAATNGQFITRAAGMFRLKGFEKAVAVHELVGWPAEAEPTRAWREAFASALQNYQRGDLSAARTGFEAVLKLKPEDGPSKFYLERIAEYGGKPSPADWTGEVLLKEK